MPSTLTDRASILALSSDMFVSYLWQIDLIFAL